MRPNRRAFLVIAGLSALSVAACGSAPQPAVPPSAQGPRFSVDRTEIDFGNVPFGRQVQATFKVTNTGTAPLVLTVSRTVRLEAGC